MKYFAALLVVLFFAIVGTIVFLGRDTADVIDAQPGHVIVADYAEDAGSRIVWEQDGKIVGNNEHYSARVTISAQRRTVELIRGYDGNVVKSRSFPNTQDAYRVFLKAMDEAEFGNMRDRDDEDSEGVCPTGYRYHYWLYDTDIAVVDSWSTSCRKSQGTFDGQSARIIRSLFKKQIPDYSEFVSGIRNI